MDARAVANRGPGAGTPSRRALVRVSRIAGPFAALAGALMLLGWAFDIEALKSIGPGSSMIKANTALGLLGAGASLLLWHLGALRAGRPGFAALRRAALALAIAVACLGLVTLAQDLFGWNLGIDEWLVADPSSGSLHGGRMSPASATGLALLGLALALLGSGAGAAILAAQTAAAMVLVLAGAALFGFLFEVEALFDLRRYNPMALQTAATLFVLGFGVLAARPGEGWVRELTAGTAGARMGRRLLLSVALILPLLGWLRLEGQRRGWYGTEFGVAILVALAIVIVALLIWSNTREANRAEARIVFLSRVYSLLSGINTLIVRVQSRDELFAQACRIAVQGGLFKFVWLGLVHRDPTMIEPVAWAGEDDGFVAKIAKRPLLRGPNPSPVVRAVTTGKPVVSNDTIADTTLQLQGDLLERGIRSAAVLPIVVDGETVAVFALHAEIPDFFSDDEMAVLSEMAGDMAFALSNLEREKTLRYLASFDPLTGVANEARLRERLRSYVKTGSRSGARLALVIFDIERFKMVNDSFGRHVGDALLKQVAARLEAWSGSGRLARIGSNQFAAIVTRIQHDTDIAHVHERAIESCFAKPYLIDGEELRIAVRTGIAVFPQDGVDESALISNAEEALKKAREIGERRVFYNPQINAKVAERLRLEIRLREAVQHNRFVLHYQPKVDVKTGALTGVEALLRWPDPELGLVGPRTLIPLLEETGLIREVGLWVIRQAVGDLARFAERGVTPCVVAVNVSALQLRQDDFVASVAGALDARSAPQLELEITESVLMRDIDKNLTKLAAIKALGVRVSIDDFGTGYSSMAYLAKLPVDCLKIDQAFVAGLQEEKVAMTLVSTMISLAHSLGLDVVAEGVETDAQASTLRLLDCDQMQGYLICKPLPFAEVLKFLEERNGLKSVA